MDCSNVSDRGRRRCPATLFPSHLLSTHHIAKQLQEEFEFFRFNSSQISTETFFHRISLMARVSTLGPSLAPCPVEASRVHDEAFIWAKSEILSFFFSAPKSSDNLTMKMASFPAMRSSTPILDPLTQSRRSRTTTSRTSTRELGFHLVGLFLNFGPSLKLWPNTKNSGFKSETTWPRSALSCLLLSTIQLISRSSIISGRRLHQRWKSDSMHWPCYYHQRTLYNRSFRASKRLPNLVSLPHLHISSFEKLCYNSIPFSEKILEPSSSYMERTIVISLRLQLTISKSCKQSILSTFVTLGVKLLAPARAKVLESFLTSLCHMTVTTSSHPRLLLEVCSTYHGFAYSKMLLSFGFQACMDYKSKYPSYLYVALGNDPYFHVLNIESFVFLSTVLGSGLLG